MRMQGLIAGASLVLILAGLGAAAQDERPVRPLSLEQCRRMAVENNLSFRVSRLSPISSEATVSAALAQFDPSFTARLFGARTQAPNTLVYNPSTGTYISQATPAQKSFSGSVGLGKQFAFGTDMGLNLSNSWSTASGRSSYGSRVTFDVTQPLLKGFGREVTESGLRIARNNLDISESQLESDAINTVQQVEAAYWDLVNAVESKKVAELSLQYAQQLLEVSRARAQSGAQAERDVIQAEVGVANARQVIISAEAAVRAAEDNLKQLTNLVSDPSAWDVSIATVDTPQIVLSLPSVDTLTAIALSNRPELYRQQKSIQSRELALRVRKNALLPTLNANASYVLNDAAPSAGKSVDDIAKASFPSWNATLLLSIPVGNRDAEASYRQAVVDVKAAGLQLESERQQVRAEVRAAVRQNETSRQQLAAALETRRLSEANLENEQERLRLGLSTNYEVLRFENDLADARRAVLQARIEHQKALLALDVATGRLLSSRNITVEPDSGQ